MVYLQRQRRGVITVKQMLFWSAFLMIPFYTLPITTVLPSIIRYLIHIVAFSFLFLSIMIDAQNRIGTLFVGITMLLFTTLLFISQWSELTEAVSYYYSMALFWYPLLIAPICIRDLEQKECKSLLVWYCLTEATTIITTIIGSTYYVEASRDLAGGNMDIIYFQRNIGGYGFVYALVLTLPYLTYAIHNAKNKIKAISILIYILAVFCIIKCQYTIAMLIAMSSIVLLLIKKPSVPKCLLTFSFLTAAFYLLSDSIAQLLTRIVLYLSNSGYNVLSMRLASINDVLGGATATGDMADRLWRYQKSAESFFHNPIFGGLLSGNVEIGRHSELLDILGSMGLIGGILLLCILAWAKKNIYIKMRDVPFSRYYSFALLFLLIISIINTISTSSLISFSVTMLPTLIYGYVKETTKLMGNTGRITT